MTTITITIGKDDFEIDAALFAERKQLAFDYLNEEAEQKANLKTLVEDLEEDTSIPKAMLTKYLKAAWKQETQKQREISELFEALDGVGAAKAED